MSSVTSRTLALLAICACGKDGGIEPDPPDGGDAAPDGASAPPPDAPAPTVCDEAKLHSDLAWIQANVFTPSCATAKCHSGPDPQVGLSLAAGAAYSNLVNKGSSTMAGWKRVVPGVIAQSYLVVALGRTAGPPPRDGFMPLNADRLCVEKLAAIDAWITAGALP